MRYLLTILAFLIGGYASSFGGTQATGDGKAEQKRVLVLYAERAEAPAIRAVDSGLREAFAARGNVELFTEHFDFARFAPDRHNSGMVDFLRDRYSVMKPDMVISAGYGALQFALEQRGALFEGVPIIYCGIERAQLEGKERPADVTGAVLFYDFRRTVGLALQLQPDAREAVCIFGDSEFDRQVGAEALAALAEHPELRVRGLHGLTYDDMLRQLRGVPAKSIVLYVSMLRDSEGKTRLSPVIVKEVCAVSAAPVYGVAEHFLDMGMAGGAMMSYSAHGREVGEIAVARLDDRKIQAGESTSSPLLVNWEALKKWKIQESRVPGEAQIRFKYPSLWEERRGLIIGIFVALAIQSLLITGLLLNRVRRRQVERSLEETTQRMLLAAEAANVGMWAWDVTAGDGWMTEQGRALFGLKHDATFDYAAILDRVHPEDRVTREAAVRRALESHGSYEMEYRVQLPDGGVRWVHARGRYLDSSNGGARKLLGISMDVTVKKKAELEAAQQRDELSHLSRIALVGEMATSLAHELNQPLTAIVTNANAAQRFLARDDMDPDELREMLADIASDGRRAGAVIRSIKGMVRKVESDRKPLDVDALITDVLRLVRADALANNCKLVTEVDPMLPRVKGDGVQLQQVLLNLIINAFDAMRRFPGNPCMVQISARRVGGKSVEISVRDSGPGLPQENPGKVFECFFSTKREGMGMGLAIAHSIVEAHGGSLAGENVEGGGARFWFCLPAFAAVVEEVPV